jgi:hypothetical protein
VRLGNTYALRTLSVVSKQQSDRLPEVNVVMGSGPREGGVLGEAAARRVKRSRLGRVHGYDPVTVCARTLRGRERGWYRRGRPSVYRR